MDAKSFRQLYLDFFAGKGHAIIGGSSLIPEHDPSVLFTTAGMHPLVPFLLGEAHPAGKRLANVQKCLRTDDITEVGDEVHLTFFEMLGNWSLGDYWKPGAIQMSYEFLTQRLGFESDRIRVTCFQGDGDAPRDLEAAEIWRTLGIPDAHITFLPKADNWWGPAGATGPCGPDTEMFYDTDPDGPPDENPATHPARFWEVWNDVFMQYDKRADGSYGQLAQKNVDTGMGLERTLAALQGVPSLYETELFSPIIDRIMSLAGKPEPFAVRVIADHLRAAVFVLAEGIVPGNVDQPYIARRLIRRAVRYGREIGIAGHFLGELAQVVLLTLSDVYTELETNRDHILTALDTEETRFQQTLRRGEREFRRAVDGCRSEGQDVMPGHLVFRLYDTYGFPPELTEELAGKQGLTADMEGFRLAFEEHQEKSRQGAAGRFKGGLAERSPETTRLHTATHLLHEALRRVLGPHVEQRGSNITAERLRFDFSHPEKLTPEQLDAVERLVNEQISRDLQVTWEEMSVDEARERGAAGLFEDRYGNQVKVYSTGDWSVEICGGPHVEQTGELGRFRIVRERSIGAGLRRIRAVLETDS
ncbi:MAG: alanine--tRNA ligase [Anaerolineae bacterium]|nr:alanine--tRNA ligase [Anaerolineae bacterium]